MSDFLVSASVGAAVVVGVAFVLYVIRTTYPR